MKLYTDIIQGSEQWLSLRAGKATASRFADILTPTGALSKSATEYIHELIGETIFPTWPQRPPTWDMQRGTEMEPEARDKFMEYTGLAVEQVGFALMDNNVIGCSPDGVIRGDTGNIESGVEIKCPTPKTHVSWVLSGGVPSQHMAQVHGSMIVLGIKKYQFWSYLPGAQPLLVDVEWNEYTDKLAKALEAFVEIYRTTWEMAMPKLVVQS